jgi:hypothetical protein
VVQRQRDRANPLDADPAACAPQGAASIPGEADSSSHRGLRIFFVAVVVGFAFGAADQYLGSRVTLGLWASTVSTASAPWLVLPFLFGCSQTRPRRAILLGLVVTMAALAGYLAAMWSPLEGVSLAQLGAEWPTLIRSQWANICGGLLTGPLFGLLGQRWRSSRSWVSAALVAGALCLEPLARWATGELWPPTFVWEIEVAAGAVLAVCFLVSGLSRDREIAQ